VDELSAQLDGGLAVPPGNGPDPPADAIAGFEQLDPQPGASQLARSAQAGDPGAYDQHVCKRFVFSGFHDGSRR